MNATGAPDPPSPIAGQAGLLFGALPGLVFRDLLRAGCVTLVGPPRAGKGALVQRLTATWEAQGGLARYLDLAASMRAVQITGDIDAVCRADLLRGLGVAEPHSSADASFQADLAQAIRRQPPRTLLVLDHCEAVPHDVAQALLKALRAALQEQAQHLGRGGLSLLLVTAGSIAGIAAGVTSPFLNMTVVHRLADLDAAAARAWLEDALAASGIVFSPDALAVLIDWFGGDRDLLQRAAGALARDPPEPPMDQPAVEALVVSLLAAVAARPAGWPLADELLDGLRDSALLFGIILDLLGGGEPPLREMRRDIGVAEASGFLTQTPRGYCFRTPFHASLARRLLPPRTLGDLAVMHGDWPRARGLYASAATAGRVDADPFALADLGLGLASCLLQTGDSDALLRTLTEMLTHCLGLADVSLLRVRGADPADFLPLTPLAHPPPGLLTQVETCARSARPEAGRAPNGQRWAVPLVLPGAAGGARVHAVVLFTLPDRALNGLRQEARRLCLLVAQGLGKRLDAERDRAFARITASIHAAADLPATLGQIAQAALDLTDAGFSSLEYWDGDVLSTQADRSAGGKAPAQYERPPPDALKAGVTGHVHRTGKPVLIGDWTAETDNFPSFRMVPGMPGAMAEAAVPVRLQGSPLGVINVESNVRWRFTGEDVAVLERLAELAAIAINNHRAETERLAAREAEHDAILGRVFAGIAHEANNHAAAIGLHAELANQDLAGGEWDPEALAQALVIIRDHAAEMGQLADDFRWLTRPGADREAIQVPLAGVIAEALKRLPERLARGPAGEPGIPINELVTTALPAPPGPVIRGRPRLLSRALENLLQNACEAVVEACDRTARKPAAGDVSIHVSQIGTDRVRIEVRDRGPGFITPLEQLNPYHTTKGAKGLGLGLPIVRQVVEAHHGHVQSIVRDDGPGACVCIDLPLFLQP